MKHANISIFIPHEGCPHQCSFCNQRYITGTFKAPNANDVEQAVITAVKSKNYDPNTTEIAFFGGSFTGIDQKLMIKLLKIGSDYIKRGDVSSLRCSTRPDYINKHILDYLEKYGVTAIELGVQSMDEKVLLQNNRGHSVAQVEDAPLSFEEFTSLAESVGEIKLDADTPVKQPAVDTTIADTELSEPKLGHWFNKNGSFAVVCTSKPVYAIWAKGDEPRFYGLYRTMDRAIKEIDRLN